MKTTLTVLMLAAVITSISAAIVPVKASVDGLSVYDANSSVEKRRKPRIKGGSGCDDARDAIEHPQCR